MPEAHMVSSVRNPQGNGALCRKPLTGVFCRLLLFLSCSSCLKPIDPPALTTLLANHLSGLSSCNPCTIFVTSVNTAPAAGVAGMDALCMTQKPVDAPSAPAGTYRALVMAEDGSRSLTSNWVLHPSTPYTSYANGPIGTTDAMARMPAALSNNIGTVSTYVWTGINATGWTAFPSATCTSWTGSGNGRYGDAGATDATAFSLNNTLCSSSPYYLYCVQQ